MRPQPDCRRTIATARAGNVIGGGDWADDPIVPDAMRTLAKGEAIPVRFFHLIFLKDLRLSSQFSYWPAMDRIFRQREGDGELKLVHLRSCTKKYGPAARIPYRHSDKS
jgi:hypothetical protein